MSVLPVICWHSTKWGEWYTCLKHVSYKIVDYCLGSVINITNEVSLSHNFPCKWVLYGLVLPKSSVIWFPNIISSVGEDLICKTGSYTTVEFTSTCLLVGPIQTHLTQITLFCLSIDTVLIPKQPRSQTFNHLPRILTLALVRLQVSSTKNSLTFFCEE